MHRESYISPRYNETQLRREFVDPFFKALGWDVDNESGYSPPPSRDELLLCCRRHAWQLADIVDPLVYKVPARELGATGWRLIRPEHAALMDRLAQSAVSLKEYTNGKICRGVVSGLTEAFVITAARRREIVSKNPEAKRVIRPFVQGRQIRRYAIEPISQYLIYTHHGIDMKAYPAVFEHLRPFRDQLEQRATEQEWYELQQPQFAYVSYFEQPKIVFPLLSQVADSRSIQKADSAPTPCILFRRQTRRCSAC